MAELFYSFIRSRKAKTFIPDHSHQRYEFVYFFGGKGVLEYNGKKVPFSKGTYYIMESNELHNELYENTGISLVVQFIPPFDELKLNSLVSNDTVLDLSHICEHMREEHKKHLLGYDIMIDSSMRQILTLLFRMSHIKTKMPVDGIRNAILYIDQYFMTDIKINSLAKDCGYCPDHFRFLFKNATSVSPKKYILDKRLALAKKLLKKSALSISEISLRCGFESYSQFMTFFKSRTKKTPGEYRALHLHGV